MARGSLAGLRSVVREAIDPGAGGQEVPRRPAPQSAGDERPNRPLYGDRRLVLKRLLDLLTVDPVAQCPGVLATLWDVARMLTGGRRAALVRVGTVVGPVALLEDSAAAVDR